MVLDLGQIIKVLLLLVLVVIIGMCVAIGRQKQLSFNGGAESSKKTYMFSGYDGSYLWYLAELLQADGVEPVKDGPITTDGHLLRGAGEPPECTYYHTVLDAAFWFSYNPAPVKYKFSNNPLWPADKPGLHRKLDLYQIMVGKPYFPKSQKITKFVYSGGNYLAVGASNTTLLRFTWSGADIHLITNETEANNIIKTYYHALWTSRAYERQTNTKIEYMLYIVELIPSKLIEEHAFILTFYIIITNTDVYLYEDHAFICINEKKYSLRDEASLVTICTDVAKVKVFPSEYPWESAPILNQVRDIVVDCKPHFVGVLDTSYKMYNMDILVDQNDKCWLLEFNSYFKFYNMPPVGEYSTAMRGLIKWMYQVGIKPNL